MKAAANNSWMLWCSWVRIESRFSESNHTKQGPSWCRDTPGQQSKKIVALACGLCFGSASNGNVCLANRRVFSSMSTWQQIVDHVHYHKALLVLLLLLFAAVFRIVTGMSTGSDLTVVNMVALKDHQYVPLFFYYFPTLQCTNWWSFEATVCKEWCNFLLNIFRILYDPIIAAIFLCVWIFAHLVSSSCQQQWTRKLLTLPSRRRWKSSDSSSSGFFPRSFTLLQIINISRKINTLNLIKFRIILTCWDFCQLHIARQRPGNPQAPPRAASRRDRVAWGQVVRNDITTKSKLSI